MTAREILTEIFTTYENLECDALLLELKIASRCAKVLHSMDDTPKNSDGQIDFTHKFVNEVVKNIQKETILEHTTNLIASLPLSKRLLIEEKFNYCFIETT